MPERDSAALSASDRARPLASVAPVLDLFAGPGGWDVAAQRLGLDPLGVELDDAACKTREAAGLRTVQYDVARYLDERYHMEAPLDGLIASPPCQTFSMAGKGSGRQALDTVLAGVDSMRVGNWFPTLEDYADPRTALVLQPLLYAREAGPQWMAWEQVPTVLPVWEACAEVLLSWGYHVWTGKLNAEEYGVPQTRKRAVLIASQTRRVDRPAASHTRYVKNGPRELTGLKPWVSMDEALGWEDDDDRPPWTAQRPSTAVACDARVPGPGHRCFTDNCHPGRKATSMFDRSNGTVRISVTEAALLQSFPASYPWQGTKTKQYQQIGNAIPPLLAQCVIAEAIGVQTTRATEVGAAA